MPAYTVSLRALIYVSLEHQGADRIYARTWQLIINNWWGIWRTVAVTQSSLQFLASWRTELSGQEQQRLWAQAALASMPHKHN